MKKIAKGLIFLAILSSVFAEIRIDTTFINISPPNALLISALLVTLINICIIKKLKKEFLYLVFWSVLYILFGATSFKVNTGGTGDHLRTVVTLFKGVLVILLMYYWLNRYGDIKRATKWFILAGIVVFVGAFVQGYMAIDSSFFAPYSVHSSQRLQELIGFNVIGGRRVSGFMQGFGLFGVYVESAALLLAIGFLKQGRRQGMSMILAFVGVAMSLFALVFSQSRSGLAATIVGYSVFYGLSALTYGRDSSIPTLRWTPLLLLLPVLTYYGPDFMQSLVDLNRVAVDNRLRVNWKALRTTVENPLLGIGFSNMKEKMGTVDTGIHNAYILLLAGGGILVFGFYMFLNVAAIRGGLKGLSPADPRAPFAIGLLSAFSAVTVECFFWGGAFATAPYILIGLLICLGKNKQDHV